MISSHRHSELEIEKQISSLRESLTREGRGSGPLDPLSQETHQLAEATQRKRQQLRDAFGIRDDYVDGTAMDPVQQAMRAAQAKAEREERIE